MSFRNKEIFDFKLYVAMATGQGDGQAGVWHLQLWGRPSHAGLHWQNLQKPHSCLHDQSKITLMGKVSIRYCRFKEKSQTKNIPLGKVSIHNKIKLVLGKVSNYKIKNWSLFLLLTNYNLCFFSPGWGFLSAEAWGPVSSEGYGECDGGETGIPRHVDIYLLQRG